MRQFQDDQKKEEDLTKHRPLRQHIGSEKHYDFLITALSLSEVNIEVLFPLTAIVARIS